MMCSIHIDESTTRVECCKAVTSSVYLFSEKLNSLLDRLNNRHMMDGSRSDALKWVQGSQKHAHYCSGAMLHEL
jgi:hypothetical protein